MLALFDLDNTLIHRQCAVDTVIADLCTRHGLNSSAQQHIAAAVRERAYPETFTALRSELGLPESAADLWAWYVGAIAAAVDCSRGVIAGLDQLRAAGWTTCIVTNGATDIQRAKLRVTGIDQHVDAVCISDEAGARKPEAAIFHSAAVQCGCDPADGGWMTGDNPATDIAGAHGAGLHTIWITAGRAWTSTGRPPDHQASDALAAVSRLLFL